MCQPGSLEEAHQVDVETPNTTRPRGIALHAPSSLLLHIRTSRSDMLLLSQRERLRILASETHALESRRDREDAEISNPKLTGIMSCMGTSHAERGVL